MFYFSVSAFTLTEASVATDDLQPFGIYRGNPAAFLKQRVIEQ
jgi:acetyltransferase-like isoleucine patch superfamily enzyme